jgi:hypothetical protein
MNPMDQGRDMQPIRDSGPESTPLLTRFGRDKRRHGLRRRSVRSGYAMERATGDLRERVANDTTTKGSGVGQPDG